VQDVEMPLEANGPVPDLKSQRAALFELEKLNIKGSLYVFSHEHELELAILARSEFKFPKVEL
jgi:hypothetical protein